jgi:adenylyl- and sulfurtransferase ThiI
MSSEVAQARGVLTDEATERERACVLAKVGEASLKGRNKRMFIDALKRNMNAALDGLARVRSGGSVLEIPLESEDAAAAVASRL